MALEAQQTEQPRTARIRQEQAQNVLTNFIPGWDNPERGPRLHQLFNYAYRNARNDHGLTDLEIIRLDRKLN